VSSELVELSNERSKVRSKVPHDPSLGYGYCIYRDEHTNSYQKGSLQIDEPLCSVSDNQPLRLRKRWVRLARPNSSSLEILTFWIWLLQLKVTAYKSLPQSKPQAATASCSVSDTQPLRLSKLITATVPIRIPRARSSVLDMVIATEGYCIQNPTTKQTTSRNSLQRLLPSGLGQTSQKSLFFS
jgi:hypothetical protein